MNNWVYKTNTKDTARFIIGEHGSNPLIFIGINPSKATPQKLDATLTRSKQFAAQLGFDGWTMINLYPQRSTLPAKIHKRRSNALIDENMEVIRDYFADRDNCTICAAWGNLIEHRPYFTECLIRLNSLIPKNSSWIQLGKSTRLNHPRHPSRISYKSKVIQFDIRGYLGQL